MNLIEFIKHPAYNYYITTLVHDCLLSDLTNVFDYNLLKYIKKPNFATNTIDYIISANIDIPNILEEYGLKESECNYMITEFPCKTINLTYEDKIVNKEDKIQDSKISI